MASSEIKTKRTLAPLGWKNFIEELLTRTASLREDLDVLKNGSTLWKIRNKGLLGLKVYKREYRLNLDELQITYTPNKIQSFARFFNFGNESVVIDLLGVDEIRTGHSSDVFNLVSKPGYTTAPPTGTTNIKDPYVQSVNLRHDHCFSIIFKNGRQPLDLVAKDRVERTLWVITLNRLLETIHSLDHQTGYERFLREKFRNADHNKSGSLTFKECQTLVKDQLGVQISKNKLLEYFNQANKTRSGKEESLDESEFLSFYYSLLKRPELDEPFKKYTSGSKHDDESKMTAEDLEKFMKTEQKMATSVEECKKIIEAFEPVDKTGLSLEGFNHFLMFSEHHDITDVTQRKSVYQDMTQPLSHYWIASSHNTYLLDDQIFSQSSVDAYITVLKKGCRCVEIDCWDGSDGDPVVCHGNTLTSKILFKDVIQDAIKPYAFHSSDYPLILSIENHCGIEQQDLMADYMKNYLGSLLFADSVDENRHALPSPDELKRKILVGLENKNALIKSKKRTSDPENEENEKISSKLSDLVNYIQPVKFQSLEHSKANEKYYHMSSLSEPHDLKVFESPELKLFDDPKESVEFVRHNMKQMTRVYPFCLRQDSSNMNVSKAWNVGCQIVALNYQTEDKETFLNQALFTFNGGSGYFLKPEFMRNESLNYSPVSPCGLDRDIFPAVKMEVKVISGQNLFLADGADCDDPYVKVKIRGHPDDEDDDSDDESATGKKFKNRGKTRPARNNGFNPVWNEHFHFYVCVPQLAFLELRVKDFSKAGKKELLGAYSTPLQAVRQGYRRVPLKDQSGKDLTPASLLIHIQITES